MKYERPEVRLLATAIAGIQDPTEKALSGFLESQNPTTYVSINAYAADE